MVALNVCGLRSKWKSMDFEEFIHKFKLVFGAEINHHSLDDLYIPNYRPILQNRKGAKRCSGGVEILFMNQLINMLNVLNLI